MTRRRLLGIGVLLAAASVGSSQDDRPSYAEKIQELRDRLGPGFQTPVDPAEFAEAIQQAQATDRASWAAPPSDREWGPSNVGHDRFPPRAQPGWGPDVTSSPGATFPRPANGPARPPVPVKTRLREAAFELERIAHHLEMADLPEESDAVREAASFLRLSARRRPNDAANEPPKAPGSR